MKNLDKSILSDIRYPAMRDVIEENLNGSIIDAPGTWSFGEGGPMRGEILRKQGARILREKGYSAEEVHQAFLRFDQERQAKRKVA